MKNRSINIIIVALLLLSVLSVVLIVFLDDAHKKFPESITVSEDGVTEKIGKIRGLKLVPTARKEYSVDFFCAASGKYEFDIEYDEIEDGGMKKFVNVKVTFDGEDIYKGTLESLLDTDTVIEFDGDLHETEPVTVVFSYEMPYEIGNEAQGTWSDFNIIFSVKKK